MVGGKALSCALSKWVVEGVSIVISNISSHLSIRGEQFARLERSLSA
jgi:hypothetical protein